MGCLGERVIVVVIHHGIIARNVHKRVEGVVEQGESDRTVGYEAVESVDGRKERVQGGDE